jgi:hypothetical protein
MKLSLPPNTQEQDETQFTTKYPKQDETQFTKYWGIWATDKKFLTSKMGLLTISQAPITNIKTGIL